MRLVTYDRDGARRLGAWVGETVVDLPDVIGHPAFPTTMEALVATNGGTTLDAARDALDRPEYVEGCDVQRPRLLAPFVPPALRDRRLILGPDDVVPWEGDEIDYQLELACIVGRPCRNLPVRHSEAAIFGYTLMNDWTARQMARAGAGRSRGRKGARPGIERFAVSLGPCVVTADGFDPTHGRLLALVDGEVWSSWDLESAQGTFAELLSAVSRDRELLPGDVLGSGTFPGGCALDLGRRLEPGSVVELMADGIGVLRNPLGRPA